MVKDEHISKSDLTILMVIARVRGLRARDARHYPSLQFIPTEEAVEKRFQRLTERGYLASSQLPSGPRIYRLSEKGARLCNAPRCFSGKPTKAIIAEMISTSSLGHVPGQQAILTSDDSQALWKALGTEVGPARIPGRYLIYTEDNAERARLELWFCELRTPDEIAKRVQTIFEKLSQIKGFAELIELGLFGFCIVVATESAKTAVETKNFPVPVRVVVVEALRDVI